MYGVENPCSCFYIVPQPRKIARGNFNFLCVYNQQKPAFLSYFALNHEHLALYCSPRFRNSRIIYKMFTICFIHPLFRICISFDFCSIPTP